MLGASMTAAFQPPRTAPARSPGSRFLASPCRRNARAANRLAGPKTAPGIFFSAPPKTRRETPSQSLGTHQESATYVFVFASGCAVGPNSAGGFVGGGGQYGGGGAGGSWDGPTPTLNGTYPSTNGIAGSGGLATAAGATGASAVAGPQLWSAGLNGGDQSVFWSGYAQGARGIAENLGGTTLEQTPIGGTLDYLSNTVGLPVPQFVWNAASATFAGNATGTAQAVILAPGATWTNIELPTLLENGVEILLVAP